MKAHNQKYEKIPQDFDLGFQEQFIAGDYEVSTDILDDVDIGDDDEDEIILATATEEAAVASAGNQRKSGIAVNGLGNNSVLELNVFNFDGKSFQSSAGQLSTLEDIMKYDFPGLEDVRVYSDFVLSYDRRNRVAHWVYEHLRAPCVGSVTMINRSNARYQEDTNIPLIFRSSLQDYQDSGYDRGHLASAANHRSNQTHCNETFYLTNIAPQVGKGFNQNAWHKLESYVRSLTLRYGSVYVCTGPLYMPKQSLDGSLSVSYELIGNNAVAVPTHFFKVVIVESKLEAGKPYMEAYIMPNTVIPDHVNLRSFLTEISVIERSSGLHFFNGLRREYFFATNLSSNSQIYSNFE